MRLIKQHPKLFPRRRSARLRGKPKISYRYSGCSRWSPFLPEVSEKGTLSLYLNPPPRANRGPPLEGLVGRHLQQYNYLPALVCGRRCLMYVDSDTNTPFMSHHLASQLGLLHLITEFQQETMAFWYGNDQVRLGLLRNVNVKIGDLDIYVDYNVFAAEDDISDDIIMDNSTLRRLGAIQTFSDRSSKLYFRRNRRMNKSSYSEYVLEAHLQNTLSGIFLGIVVDTGADYFYISRDCRRRIRQASQCKQLRRVRILSRDGCTFFRA